MIAYSMQYSIVGASVKQLISFKCTLLSIHPLICSQHLFCYFHFLQKILASWFKKKRERITCSIKPWHRRYNVKHSVVKYSLLPALSLKSKIFIFFSTSLKFHFSHFMCFRWSMIKLWKKWNFSEFYWFSELLRTIELS